MPSKYVGKRPHYDTRAISSAAETESHTLEAKAKLHTSSPAPDRHRRGFRSPSDDLKCSRLRYGNLGDVEKQRKAEAVLDVSEVTLVELEVFRFSNVR